MCGSQPGLLSTCSLPFPPGSASWQLFHISTCCADSVSPSLRVLWSRKQPHVDFRPVASCKPSLGQTPGGAGLHLCPLSVVSSPSAELVRGPQCPSYRRALVAELPAALMEPATRRRRTRLLPAPGRRGVAQPCCGTLITPWSLPGLSPSP